MNLEFNGLPVNIIKSKRKTISIQLKPTEIIMRVPNRFEQTTSSLVVLIWFFLPQLLTKSHKKERNVVPLFYIY